MTKEESIKEYFFRINKSIDYIKCNLQGELSLHTLARHANFSKFHFHRIFKAVVGKSLNEFIIQARIERSLFFLANHAAKPIGEIALECGFADTSSFSRCFKEIKKVSASQWRMAYKNSKICKEESKICTWPLTAENYLAHKLDQAKMNRMSKKNQIDVKVIELPELNVAYVRNLNVHIHDSATFENMFSLLFEWAGPKGLLNFPQTKALTVYRSNANLSGVVQADVCLTVPDTIEGEGLIGTTKISGGLYAVVHKEAAIEECFTTWDYIFDVWFEENGYQPDHRNFYINHLNDAKLHPQKLHIFDMCIPVKPL